MQRLLSLLLCVCLRLFLDLYTNLSQHSIQYMRERETLSQNCPSIVCIYMYVCVCVGGERERARARASDCELERAREYIYIYIYMYVCK